MVLKIQSSAFMLILMVLFSGVVGGSDYNSAAATLLDRISIGEGTSDDAAQEHDLASAYDITYAYGQYNPEDSKPLTEMTIGEVKQLQQQMLANQASSKLPSSAVGKYQLISTTLVEQQNKLGLSDDTKFDAATQELFGLSLLEKRGYKEWTEGKISDYQFQKNMAKEWASVADPDTGKSYYGQGVGTTDTQIKAAMAQAKSIATNAQELAKTTPVAVEVFSLGIPTEDKKPDVALTLYVHDGSISGPVIPHAQVTGKDASGNSFQQTTDSNGYVTITGEPGTWSFSASVNGYETNNWDQEITETDRKDAYLQKEQQASESSVVGKWAFQGEGECVYTSDKVHDNPDTPNEWDSIIDFHRDGTFTHVVDGVTGVSTGEWVQKGDTIRLQFNLWSDSTSPDGVWKSVSWQSEGDTYEGTINGDTMSGTGSSLTHHDMDYEEVPSESYSYDTTCSYRWTASRVDAGS